MYSELVCMLDRLLVTAVLAYALVIVLVASGRNCFFFRQTANTGELFLAVVCTGGLLYHDSLIKGVRLCVISMTLCTNFGMF